jgi:hypothetical protein
MVCTLTRAWPQSGLDHLYTNRPGKLSEVYTEYTDGSDHKLIKVTRIAKSLQKNLRYVRKRCNKNFDEDKFREKVGELSCYDLYMCDDPNEAVQCLADKLTSILDHLAPVKTLRTRTRYAPCLSRETKSTMKDRDKGQRHATESQHPDY